VKKKGHTTLRKQPLHGGRIGHYFLSPSSGKKKGKKFKSRMGGGREASDPFYQSAEGGGTFIVFRREETHRKERDALKETWRILRKGRRGQGRTGKVPNPFISLCPTVPLSLPRGRGRGGIGRRIPRKKREKQRHGSFCPEHPEWRIHIPRLLTFE